ncbi:hypothetical protein C8F01DRAFT_768802 [Mycena amicta]|nr:hypothetical protein C8F01DRAFT_768802 [Mycena amicta]
MATSPRDLFPFLIAIFPLAFHPPPSLSLAEFFLPSFLSYSLTYMPSSSWSLAPARLLISAPPLFLLWLPPHSSRLSRLFHSLPRPILVSRAALTNSSRRLCRAILPASDPWPQARTDDALAVGRHWHSLPSAEWRRMLYCCGLGVQRELRGSRLEEDRLKWLPPRRRDVWTRAMEGVVAGGAALAGRSVREHCMCRGWCSSSARAIQQSRSITPSLSHSRPLPPLSLRISHAQDDKCRAEWSYLECDWVGGGEKVDRHGTAGA